MAQNREIKLSSLLTDKFFEYKKEEELAVAVTFPLPASPKELPEFLETLESLAEYKIKLEHELLLTQQRIENPEIEADNRLILEQGIAILKEDLEKIPARIARVPKNKEKSESYKAGFAKMMDELAVWIKENNLNVDAVEKFKKNI